MRRIALIGCSSRKLGKDAPNDMYPAGKIYVGKNFLKAKQQGISHFGCEKEFYILSGKYGLLNQNEPISFYNTYLGDFSEEEKRAWAMKVLDQLGRNFNLENTQFVIFAGRDYSKYIKNNLNCITLKYNHRILTFEVDEVLNNGGKNYERDRSI